MKKFKFILLALGLFCILSSYGQEEFFGNKTGLSVSGSSNFSTENSGGLSLHLKNGLIFSGEFILSNEGDNIPTTETVGYLFDFNKNSEKNKINGIVSLSNLSSNLGSVGYITPTLGIIYTSFQSENYPTSLGLSASAYFYQFNFNFIEQSNLTLYFAQAFYAQNTVYPVIGLTYSIPLTNAYGDTNGGGSYLFHVGLNIRLSKPDKRK